MTMNDEINTEQPLILQPQCVDCRFYDGFGACTKHGYQLRDNCEDFVDMETTHKYVDDMENYEQKYNAALERAKDLMTKQNPPAFNKDLISLIFPELKESEDEKIRKDIIRVFKGEISFTSEKESKKYIAWLEKQSHMLDPDKVIEWLKAKVYDDSTYGMAMIDKFKKDFGLWNDKMN